MKARAEWRRAPDFAEFAEALGVPTNCIMAARPNDSIVVVLYTAEPDEHGFDPDEPILLGQLARDEDGILRKVAETTITSMDWRSLEAQVAAVMERKLNDEQAR